MGNRGETVRITEHEININGTEYDEVARLVTSTMGGVAVIETLQGAPRSSRNNQFDYSTDETPVPRDIDSDDFEWRQSALCTQTDPEAFFPEKGGSTRDAKKVCTSCDVRDQCLQYALENNERFGIWGGLSERERLKLKRKTQNVV